MTTHVSATMRTEAPHLTNSTKTNPFNQNRSLSNRLKRRARSVVNNTFIDAGTRAIIRYGLETNDPWLAELVRRVNAGENLSDTLDFSPTIVPTGDDSIEEKIETLTGIICSADTTATKSAALLVLLAILEQAPQPRALANTAKHLAFTHCGELNVFGMVDAQIAALEHELLTRSS